MPVIGCDPCKNSSTTIGSDADVVRSAAGAGASAGGSRSAEFATLSSSEAIFRCRLLLFGAMLLVVSWATAVEAQLSWAEAEAVVEPAAGQRWVEASFAFENGPAPVTVVALRTDSDRLSAELVQTSPTYGAGDTGLVKLRYRNSGVPEAEEVAVVVETDAVRDPEHRLVLKLLPPGELERRQARRELEQRRRDWQAPYVVEPRVLRWEVGESEAKTATLTLAEDAEPTTALPGGGRAGTHSVPAVERALRGGDARGGAGASGADHGEADRGPDARVRAARRHRLGRGSTRGGPDAGRPGGAVASRVDAASGPAPT